jgi:hypothetical protein
MKLSKIIYFTSLSIFCSVFGKEEREAGFAFVGGCRSENCDAFCIRCRAIDSICYVCLLNLYGNLILRNIKSTFELFLFLVGPEGLQKKLQKLDPIQLEGGFGGMQLKIQTNPKEI